MISTAGSTVLAFSLTGGSIPAGCGTLVDLNLTGEATGLSGIVVSDQTGAAIDFEYYVGGDEPDLVYDCSDEYPDCASNFYDCAGECGGSAVEDECGVCGGDGIADGECDCDGNVEDCAGECGGSAVEDECGECGGDGMADGECDCDGNVEDDCGICDGDSTSCCPDGQVSVNGTCYSQNDLDVLVDIAEGVGIANSYEDVLGLNCNTGHFSWAPYLEWNDEGRLTQMNFDVECPMTDFIPESIGNLDQLTIYRLNSSGFSGDLPHSITNLTNLNILDIYIAPDMTGTLPDNIGDLSNLSWLSIASTDMSGSIPGSIGQLTNLSSHLYLY
jgi:hypothetical protein